MRAHPLQNLEQPISVATYQLRDQRPASMQDALPCPERLQQELDMAATDLEDALGKSPASKIN